MAAKIEIAQNRMFRNVFICKDCGAKVRADSLRINSNKVRCRKCSGRAFRPIKRK